MYRFHRYNLIRWDISSPSVAYKLFVRGLYDYVIVKEETSSSVTTRSYFVASKAIETNWSDRASLTYSEDIQGRKLLNEGQNWLAAAIGQITELLTGVNYRVEDYPLVWIEDTYYTTYKDDIFQVSIKTDVPTQAEYANVLSIDLSNESLTTNFSSTFLGKFANLNSLALADNVSISLDLSLNAKLESLAIKGNSLTSIDVSNNPLLTGLFVQENSLTSIDISNNTALVSFRINTNSLTSIDVSNNTEIQLFYCFSNSLTTLDISNNTKINNLRCQANQLTAAVNSQILIDLDGHGLSNGYLNSSIFGGGSLTAAGAVAKSNLLSKGWTIVGI